MIISQILAKDLSPRLINSMLSALVIFIIASLVYFIFLRKYASTRQRQKVKHRIAYIATLVFLLVMVRVWIEGFTHIFTMLSLIAAGIVVTNKENIMNLSGWLIINWRGVFSEGDYIQIDDVIGYVESVKPMSFKVLETVSLGENRATGKTIKVPNGLIITTPVVIFPSDNTLLLKHIECKVPANNALASTAQRFEAALHAAISSLYENDPNYSVKTIRKNNKALSQLIQLTPTTEIKLMPDNPDQLLIRLYFYCYPKDFPQIEKSLAVSVAA